MQKRLIIVLLTFCFTKVVFPQDQFKYSALAKEAFKLYEAKDYRNASKRYSEAFKVTGVKIRASDRYYAACSWALVGEPDSAFVQLFEIAEKGMFSNLAHITSNTDLNSLHGDRRWEKVIQAVKANKQVADAKLDKYLVAVLDTVWQEDQKYREQISEIRRKYGRESAEMNALWETIKKKDSINLIRVKNILNKRGWLGPDIIGYRGSSALFLVVQHADLESQSKYLPMIREAVKKGQANAADLALLEDRVALGKGGRQIYGSQVRRDDNTGTYYVSPLIDPDQVDKRRAEVGLEPIQSYLSSWGITWNVEEYKRKLPEYERMYREGN